MSSTKTVIDQELAQFGWVESIATNSISDFKLTQSNFAEQITNKNKPDFVDSFICHMIFYVIFCYSLFLYIFVDLGFGSVIVETNTTFIKIANSKRSPKLHKSSIAILTKEI